MENAFCPKCGSKEAGNNFCTKCGNKLANEEVKKESINKMTDIGKPVKEDFTAYKEKKSEDLSDTQKDFNSRAQGVIPTAIKNILDKIKLKEEKSNNSNKLKSLHHKHLLASIILLFPANVYLKYTTTGFNHIDYYGAISNYFTAVIFSVVIAALSWGIFDLVKKKSSFIKALYKTFYVMSFICFSVYWMGYIVGKFLN